MQEVDSSQVPTIPQEETLSAIEPKTVVPLHI